MFGPNHSPTILPSDTPICATPKQTKIKKSHNAENAKESTRWAFLSSSWLHKIKITKEGTLWRQQEILGKSHNAEKGKREYPLSFFIVQLVAENQNNQRGHQRQKFGKNLSMPKIAKAKNQSRIYGKGVGLGFFVTRSNPTYTNLLKLHT